MPFNTDNKHLVASLAKTFGELLSPLEVSIRAVWRGTFAPPDAKVVLDNQLLAIARRFVNLRGCSAEEKQRYDEDIRRSFRRTQSNSINYS